MDRRVSGKALIGGALIVLASAMSACVGAGGQNMEAYPKFSDIPQRPAAKAATGTSNDARTLQAIAAELARQDVTIQANTAMSSDSARALAAIPAVSAADDAATEAFARAARARAAPPPSRK